MNQQITQCAPRIKLIIDDENYVDRLKELDNIAYDLRNLRNDVMRECVTYLQHQLNGGVLLNKLGKNLSYNSYVTSKRKDYKNAPATQINWTEFLTVPLFQAKKKDIIRGECNVPMFKDKSIVVAPFPTSKIYEENGEWKLKPSAMNKIVFKMINVHKDKSILAILNRIVAGEYKCNFSKIIKDDKFWYLHLSYGFENTTEYGLDENKICGVDLGWKVPACCAINEGYDHVYLGDSALLERFKTQVKNRRRKLQKCINDCRSGHGKKRKLKALNSIQDKESNFVKNFNHTISKKVIDFCLKNNCGTIHVIKFTKEVKQNKFLTEFWSYYQLQQMIEYKAKHYGISVKYIDPAYTSQTCSKCGHIDSDNRQSQAEFKCTKCGHKSNADYNAAVNIARSNNLIIPDNDTRKSKAKSIA